MAPNAQMPMAPPAERAAGPEPAPPLQPSSLPPLTPPGASQAKEPAVQLDKGDQAEHMLIFRGALDLIVEGDKIQSTLDAVIDEAAAVGGYIASQDDRSVTVRVPSSRFRQALRAVEKLGEVAHRSVQAQDVTEEFHDLGIRLKSLQATRDRLQEFLGRAKTIEEVLRLEQELGRIAGEIDKIEGRMRFLEAQAAFSTLTVSLTGKAKPTVVVEQKAPPPPSPRTAALPIEWLGAVGLDSLLHLD
jgi:hypothetical protein